MAYVVLARKYRPQRFADLVGQEHVTRTLANAIAHDRVHHAYLFCARAASARPPPRGSWPSAWCA
ncbi:hypothetical protein [Nannocystis pusilla]|uniref:hypothetical protein n=1 Tax=Nannocystis pusilla TaxID=889268 RepID=UPI003B7A65B9